MNPVGYLLYRCRRCGHIVRNRSVPDFMSTVSETAFASARDRHVSGLPPMLDNHLCQTGAIGVTDLIGAESFDLAPAACVTK